MNKWYKESYFNRKNWLLENFDKLNLSSDELVLILLIELCKESKKVITYEYLTNKMHKSSKDIDNIIASLVSKHYLKLNTNSKGLVFDIDEIFEFDPEKYEISDNKNLYDTLGDLFGKPLTPSELQKVNDLINEYGEANFKYAVRVAEAQRKLKLPYIEGVLRNESKRQENN